MVRQASETGGSAQPQVFISYASQDAEKVIPIVRLLENEGATVWRDQEHILGGQYYGEQIVHAIAHSRVVVLMCSPQAFQSDNVHREVLLTWDHYHRRYIPVWISPTTEIPERFRYCLTGCQWIDAHSQPRERWLPQLLKAFEALGVETTNPAADPGQPAPRSIDESDRRGLRFRPGDKPIRGADWELVRLLGKGGFGEVWKARNTHLESVPPVALKFCLELDDRAKGLLKHEADMVLRAQQQIRSSGIVPLLHAYLGNDPPCLEYPYIEGGTMVQLLDGYRDSAGSFTPAQVERIIHRIAQIVGPAHRATPKLVHRDLKPSNVLVQHRGEGKLVLRVTDFGIGGLAAQPALDRSRSSSSMKENMASVLMGSYSPLYASPQQIRGDRPDPRDDVYALGVIWYQFLMGDLAGPAPTGRRWMDVLRGRGMSDPAVQLLSSCFETDPVYRPADLGALAEQLKALPTATLTKPAASTFEFSVVEAEPYQSPEPSRPPLGKGVPSRPGERAAKPARTQVLSAEMTKSQDALPVPTDQDAEAPATVDRFAASRAFKWSVAAGAIALVVLLGVIVHVATDDGTDVNLPPTPQGGSGRAASPSPSLSQSQSAPAELKPPTVAIADRRPERVPLPRKKQPLRTQPSREWTNSIGMKFVRIEPGEFLMGSSKDQIDQLMRLLKRSPHPEWWKGEQPQHGVKLTRPFLLGVHEATQGQYQAVMGENPSGFKGSAYLPVEQVSWMDAVNFCNKLSGLEGRKPYYRVAGNVVSVAGGNGYRLPTEAEWEYACRAGTPAFYGFGDDAGAVGEYAWYVPNSAKTTHPVGQKRPNAWGLYDMLGNVWEWCGDGYDERYYDGWVYGLSVATDPPGAPRASKRVTRGGAFECFMGFCRPAFRGGDVPGARWNFLGFRVAAVPE